MRLSTKARNFRLSEETMRKLDELVIHYMHKTEHGFFQRNVTRTDVIVALITGDHKRLEDEAKALREKAAKVLKETEVEQKKNRKAVSK